MLTIIITVAIIGVLMYINFDCNKKVRENLSKPAILIFSSIIYFFMVLIYLYINFDHCYQHISILDAKIIFLLVLISFVTFAINLTYIHGDLNFLKYFSF